MIEGKLAASGSEHGHQAELFAWAALHMAKLPELRWLFHIQNASANRSARTVGVKAGVPDIFLPIRRGRFMGLWIELKRPVSIEKKVKAGKPSKEQLDWKDHLLSEGYGVYVAYGWVDARDIIVDYLRWDNK